MAKAVRVQWSVAQQVVSNGALYTRYRVSLRGAQTMELPAGLFSTSVTFPAVPAGAYTAAVDLVNEMGDLTGPGAVSDTFTVIDDASRDVPTTVSVTVGSVA